MSYGVGPKGPEMIDAALYVQLPTFVYLEVTASEPGVRGDTATGGQKPAKLETGAVVRVPLFLNEPHSVTAAEWYAREKSELVAAAWCVPEFASALGIKRRTGAISSHINLFKPSRRLLPFSKSLDSRAMNIS